MLGGFFPPRIAPSPPPEKRHLLCSLFAKTKNEKKLRLLHRRTGGALFRALLSAVERKKTVIHTRPAEWQYNIRICVRAYLHVRPVPARMTYIK